MKPIKLTMQGFGSYGSSPQTIDFTEPDQSIFLIAGDTGAGKSTIFDAIVFALYGESASASKNKKGEELQSQFSSFDITPFVELEFSEREDGQERLYKVRRVPAHRRLKERGSGTTKGDAEVCLTLPNGEVPDRPISRVDEKIADIVKLDKGQFKKVAMLAQGEFLAMLSASSKEKKQIFRGIFDTEIYVSIADALTRRRTALKQKMDAKFAAFRAAASQLHAVPGYDVSDKLQLLVDDIATSDALDVVYAEELACELAQFNDEVRVELERLESDQDDKRRTYEAALAALQKGKALSRSFEQREKANADLERCKLEEADMAAKAELVEKIDAAFDISNASELYSQASDECARSIEQMEQLRSNLPEMEEASNKARFLLESARQASQEASERSEVLASSMKLVMDALRSASKAQRSVSDKRSAFVLAKSSYESARDSFEKANAAFLDSQAGYIAKELKQGEPCPVCGSIEHPRPHTASRADVALSPDVLDKLKREYEAANAAQMAASAEAGHALEAFNGALDDLSAALSALDVRFASEASELVLMLRPIAEDRSCDLGTHDIGDSLSTAEVIADSISGKARQSADKAASVLRDAQERAGGAQTHLEVALGSIERIKDALPEAEARRDEFKSALERLLSDKGEAGTGWEEIVAAHSKAEIQQLRSVLDEFNGFRAMAQGAKEAAEEAIGNSSPPDIGKLSAAVDTAKGTMDDGYRKLTALTASYEANKRALEGVEASFGEWSASSREFATADELYKRLSGARSGERMDLETFVQRYYFRQILKDANRRLREMTNNEYEFRMVDEESAGTGSNKGLDLMVYSATNDAVRDIKTLSGGESFMAALAFALGLSDQIMAKRSAVNLDIMFIDEGFGSLDDNARKQAVDTLRSMTGDGRMIGIISHVAELKQSIDDQLIVTKDAEGSHAHWHMN